MTIERLAQQISGSLTQPDPKAVIIHAPGNPSLPEISVASPSDFEKVLKRVHELGINTLVTPIPPGPEGRFVGWIVGQCPQGMRKHVTEAEPYRAAFVDFQVERIKRLRSAFVYDHSGYIHNGKEHFPPFILDGYFFGRTYHLSMPDFGCNPQEVMPEIISRLQADNYTVKIKESAGISSLTDSWTTFGWTVTVFKP